MLVVDYIVDHIVDLIIKSSFNEDYSELRSSQSRWRIKFTSCTNVNSLHFSDESRSAMTKNQ